MTPDGAERWAAEPDVAVALAHNCPAVVTHFELARDVANLMSSLHARYVWAIVPYTAPHPDRSGICFGFFYISVYCCGCVLSS